MDVYEIQENAPVRSPPFYFMSVVLKQQLINNQLAVNITRHVSTGTIISEYGSPREFLKRNASESV